MKHCLVHSFLLVMALVSSTSTQLKRRFSTVFFCNCSTQTISQIQTIQVLNRSSGEVARCRTFTDVSKEQIASLFRPIPAWEQRSRALSFPAIHCSACSARLTRSWRWQWFVLPKVGSLHRIMSQRTVLIAAAILSFFQSFLKDALHYSLRLNDLDL
jgi:hypothetical protein